MQAKHRGNDRKNQHDHNSGKRHTHTIKFQLLMHLKTGHILQTAVAERHQYDITLAREQIKDLPLGTICRADLDYQGLELAGATVLLPFKKPRHGSLLDKAKHFNQALARHRIKVEHRIVPWKSFAC